MVSIVLKWTLGARGLERRKAIEAREKAVAEEAWRQEHDPKCIAKRIWSALWRATIKHGTERGEFSRITLVSKDGSEFFAMFPNMGTDQFPSPGRNVPRVVCEAPETGLEYLNANRAGEIDPWQLYRIKKFYHF